uniref:Rapid ALkalinization Factor n=2 Tax=Populus trichocarpa TaxID=3694 RepID=A0A2K1Z676_POPTR
MINTNISNMKAFLVIICILLATIVFSPSSTCTARELLGGKDPHTGWPPASSGSPCGANKKKCLPNPNPGPNKPKKRRCESPIEQSDCEPN